MSTDHTDATALDTLDPQAVADVLLDTAAAVLGAAIPDDYRDGVHANLVIAAEMADRLYRVPLDDHEIDLANRFEPTQP